MNLDVICLTETCHVLNYCNFLIYSYQSYYSKLKINQNDEVMILVKYGLCVDFFEYKYVNANILSYFKNK